LGAKWIRIGRATRPRVLAMVKGSAMSERVKIDFQLNPEDQQGHETEKVWAERVGTNEFRVLNSPFFVFGMSADDVVSFIWACGPPIDMKIRLTRHVYDQSCVDGKGCLHSG
jgi:hypothetical protein